jgi:hypothetical protein
MVLNLQPGESCKKYAKFYNNPNQKRPEREDDDGADEDGEDEDKEDEDEDEEGGADDGETGARAQAENESQDVSQEEAPARLSRAATNRIRNYDASGKEIATGGGRSGGGRSAGGRSGGGRSGGGSGGGSGGARSDGGRSAGAGGAGGSADAAGGAAVTPQKIASLMRELGAGGSHKKKRESREVPVTECVKWILQDGIYRPMLPAPSAPGEVEAAADVDAASMLPAPSAPGDVEAAAVVDAASAAEVLVDNAQDDVDAEIAAATVSLHALETQSKAQRAVPCDVQ